MPEHWRKFRSLISHPCPCPAADVQAVSPNSKIPAIVDYDTVDGKPQTVFESGVGLPTSGVQGVHPPPFPPPYRSHSMLQLASNRLHSWLSGGGVWAPQVRGHPALPRAEDWPILAR